MKFSFFSQGLHFLRFLAAQSSSPGRAVFASCDEELLSEPRLSSRRQARAVTQVGTSGQLARGRGCYVPYLSL